MRQRVSKAAFTGPVPTWAKFSYTPVAEWPNGPWAFYKTIPPWILGFSEHSATPL